jgi:inner membrane protein
MDPLTQGLLGAAVGEMVAGPRIGRRAMLWGALLGMSPDLDVLVAPLHAGFGEWLYHRGTTHSLWFGFVVGPVVAWLLWRWRDPDGATPLGAWVAMAVTALVTHPILDGFTPYGTQLFAPFWRERFAWNGVAIVDPFYTLPLAMGVFFAASRRFSPARRRAVLQAALVLTSVYVLAGVALNRWAEEEVRTALESEGRRVGEVRVYPTVLQPWLRHFVAHADGRVITGWQSATLPSCPAWRERATPARSERAQAVLETWEGGILEWFADGQIAIYEDETPAGTLLVIDDLRYTWASATGRSMWGVAARFDASDRLLGPVQRFERRDAALADLSGLLDAIAGRLPGREAGFRTPSSCDGSVQTAR